jgi:hypothetical protein
MFRLLIYKNNPKWCEIAVNLAAFFIFIYKLLLQTYESIILHWHEIRLYLVKLYYEKNILELLFYYQILFSTTNR